MKKKRTMILIITLALTIVLIGGSYAYFSVMFNDNRNEESGTNTSIKTCHIAEATRIENIEDSVGSFQANDIYPGHKEIASLSVTASGVIGATSSFQFIYDIEENTLKDNIKVSVYGSNEKISTTENYFNCKKEVANENGITKYYETCEEKELGSLLSETILTEETKQVIGKDTLVITNDRIDKTKYYYVVLEFLNKDESQNEYQNKVLKGKVNVELTHEKSIYTECILNGADPVLKDELIPITINADGVVRKVDVSEKWYSYENKEWANAVILKDENISYENNEVIPEDNIESYFVWIPKYRYQLWDLGNYNGLTSIDESKVHTIPLVFGDYNTKDDVDGECTTPMLSGESGACQVGDYMTHPAFLSIPSTGFWVGKFETSKSNSNPDNSINPSGIQIKPDQVSWRNIQVGNAFYSTYDYKRNLDSHMMKNTEWGAVAYLGHSEYGSHESVRINNHSGYITGYAAVKEPTCGYTGDNRSCNQYGMASNITQPYHTEIGILASTTGNITGIYDMSGGAFEFTIGVMTDANGTPLSGKNDSLNSGFVGSFGEGGSLANGHSWPKSRYYDIYIYESAHTEYTRGILGDATSEEGPFANIKYGSEIRQISSWYADLTHFVYFSHPWFARGGAFNYGLDSGIFAFGANFGSTNATIGFRIILTPTL